MTEWFGTSWSAVAFVALSSLLIYVSSLVAIRVSGRKRDGEILQDALASSGMADEELLSKLRQHGVRDVAEVQAAIVGSTGELSVFTRADGQHLSERLLRDVAHID